MKSKDHFIISGIAINISGFIFSSLHGDHSQRRGIESLIRAGRHPPVLLQRSSIHPQMVSIPELVSIPFYLDHL